MIIPKKNYKNLIKYSKYEINSMQPKILTGWKKAKDCHVWDFSNHKLIDFTSSIFVSNIGHSNSEFKKRIIKTLNSPISHSYNYFNYPRAEYTKSLIKFVNNKKLNKCYLLSSGTEALEATIKLMRLHGQRSKFSKEKNGIISIKGNWHGRTMGAQMLGGKTLQSSWIGFHDKNMFHLNFPYPWETSSKHSKKFFENSLKKCFKKKFNFKKRITGFILEAFQGWGAFFYPIEYIEAIKKFCKKNKILIAIDEMQSGFGRTGYKFLYEYYKLDPDIVCCGKAMGSGLPISGVISSSKIMNIPKIGDMSSTHSANPLVCSAGLATLEVIKKKKLVYRSKKLGMLFKKQLEKIQYSFPNLIKMINCKGLIAAIIFKDLKKIKGKEIADAVTINCYENGLLVVNTGRESIKLGPPLTISSKLLLKSTEIIFNQIQKIQLKYVK